MASAVEGLVIETHSWDKACAFWTGLGYEVEFATDHCSGQLRHPEGGAYVFLMEVPGSKPVEMTPVVTVEETSKFSAPATGTIERQFTPEHWGVSELILQDPDGNRLRVQAPLPTVAPTGG
jgi:hypothetical protein